MTCDPADAANRDRVFALNADLQAQAAMNLASALEADAYTRESAIAWFDRLQEAYKELEAAVLLVTVPAGVPVWGRERVQAALARIDAVRKERP